MATTTGGGLNTHYAPAALVSRLRVPTASSTTTAPIHAHMDEHVAAGPDPAPVLRVAAPGEPAPKRSRWSWRTTLRSGLSKISGLEEVHAAEEVEGLKAYSAQHLFSRCFKDPELEREYLKDFFAARGVAGRATIIVLVLSYTAIIIDRVANGGSFSGAS